MSRKFFAAVLGTAALLLCPDHLVAQIDESPLLPNVRFFPGPLADHSEPRFGIALTATNLFERIGPERPLYDNPDESEIQATAALGGTLPLLRLLQRPDGGIVLTAQAGVIARFRIQKSSRDDLGQDWMVGGALEMAQGGTSARLRVVHKSSHLGDEFGQSTGAMRIEMGGEALDALFAVRRGAVRLYGGGGWVFHSNTDDTDVLEDLHRLDRFTAQAGADLEVNPFADTRWGLLAGADWQTAERTNWRSSFGLAGGVRFRVGVREAGLTARFAGGPSMMGQFFLTREEAWSLELTFK